MARQHFWCGPLIRRRSPLPGIRILSKRRGDKKKFIGKSPRAATRTIRHVRDATVCDNKSRKQERERERERGETDCRLIYGCGDDAESEWAVSPVPLTRIRRQARRPNGRTDFVHIQIRRTERERKREVLHATSNSNDKQLFTALFVWVGKQNRDETKRRKKECTTQRRMKDRKRRNVNEVSALSLWAAPAAAQISNDAPISGPAKEEKMER